VQPSTFRSREPAAAAARAQRAKQPLDSLAQTDYTQRGKGGEVEVLTCELYVDVDRPRNIRPRAVTARPAPAAGDVTSQGMHEADRHLGSCLPAPRRATRALRMCRHLAQAGPPPVTLLLEAARDGGSEWRT